jgi:hypothetical protein
MKLNSVYSIAFASAVLCSTNGTEHRDGDQNGISQNTAKLQETKEPMAKKKTRVSRSTKVYYESGSYGKPLNEKGKTDKADSLNNK